MKTLKQKLLDAKVPIDVRYSDLQCEDCEIARRIIREHRYESAVKFKCNVSKKNWLELPFMNEDYFNNKR